MSRRLPTLVALVAALAIAACQGTPSAPALTDPKEILVQSTTALQNVKTFEIRGSFGGSINAEGMGEFDLDQVTLTLGADVDAKKARLEVDAPTLLGTKVDVIVLPDNVFFKLTGPLAGFAGLDPSGKYVQQPIDGDTVPEEATDPDKAIAELREGIDDLPTPPEKLADERCGDQDCYHVRISLTAEQVAELSSDAGEVGPMSFDIWSRKNDLRPAKLAFSFDAGEMGNVTGTFDITYDGSFSVEAPPADQIVDGS